MTENKFVVNVRIVQGRKEKHYLHMKMPDYSGGDCKGGLIEYVDAFADDALPDDEATKLSEHMGNCQSCTGRYNENKNYEKLKSGDYMPETLDSIIHNNDMVISEFARKTYHFTRSETPESDMSEKEYEAVKKHIDSCVECLLSAKEAYDLVVENEIIHGPDMPNPEPVRISVLDNCMTLHFFPPNQNK